MNGDNQYTKVIYEPTGEEYEQRKAEARAMHTRKQKSHKALPEPGPYEIPVISVREWLGAGRL